MIAIDRARVIPLIDFWWRAVTSAFILMIAAGGLAWVVGPDSYPEWPYIVLIGIPAGLVYGWWLWRRYRSGIDSIEWIWESRAAAGAFWDVLLVIFAMSFLPEMTGWSWGVELDGWYLGMFAVLDYTTRSLLIFHVEA